MSSAMRGSSRARVAVLCGRLCVAAVDMPLVLA
jgi:hypothetical protein